MDKIQALLMTDSVRSFPSIQLPEPKISSSLILSKNDRRQKIKFNIPSDIPVQPKDSKLPGVVKGYKPPLVDKNNKNKTNDKNLLTGFNSANLMLDSNKIEEMIESNNINAKQPHLSSINLNKSLDSLATTPTTTKTIKKSDKVMNELRNYLQLMDQYSMQSFIIYDGRALRDTPEFQSIKKMYGHAWGSMSYIITQLEKFMREYGIKMAVIEGPKVYNLSQLNLSYYDKNELLTCVANAEQIKPQLSLALTESGIKQLNQSVIKVQSLIRRFLAKKRVIVLRSRWFSIIKIQSHFRRRQLRKHMIKLSKLNHAIIDDKWNINKNKLMKWWKNTKEFANININNNTTRYIDKQLDNIRSLQSIQLNNNQDASNNDLLNSPKYRSTNGPLSNEINQLLQSQSNRQLNKQSSSQLDKVNSNNSIDTTFSTNIINSNDLYVDPSDIEFMKPMIPNRTRLIIHIPSLHTAEYNRLDMEYLSIYENRHISVLYQLYDPDVHIIYVSPVPLTVNEVAYHEHMCELLGIATTPKRLHFIVPELLNRLPNHLSLAQILLCSTSALNRIKNFINRIPNAMIVTTSISWAEKKLVDYLNLPMLSPEPLMSTTIHSNSFIKRQFIENKLNIPLGAFDIYTKEDLYIALSRLISTNLDIKRWKIKLNYDFNNDSIIYLDTDKLSLVQTLRKEQSKLLDSNKNNLLSWFSRPVQFSIRQRIILTLNSDLYKRITICHKNLYSSLEQYIGYIEMYGCVIEAEPIEKTGNVQGLCFVDPTGKVTYYGGVDVIMDDKYQIQGYIYPQTKVPILALEQATITIVKSLHKKFEVIGYVTIKYVVCFDGLDNIPKTLAEGIYLGMTPVFTSLSNVSILTMNDVAIGKSLLPAEFPSNRSVVIIPMAIHEPLKGSRDDIFFKLCHMKGISYDRNRKTGTLFNLIDSILSGAVSFITICSSRRKAIDLAIYVCNFIIQQYGKLPGDIEMSWEQVTSILSSLRYIMKQDNKIT